MAEKTGDKVESGKPPKPTEKKETKAPPKPKKTEEKKAKVEPPKKAETKPEKPPKTEVKKVTPKAKETAPKTKKPAPKKPSRKIRKGPDIGIDVALPKKDCKDKFCPFHGNLPVRGQILEGIVMSDRMQGSAVVKREYMRLNKKYERLEKRSSKYLVHSPPCQEVKEGDRVKIMECRPLSKNIAYVVIENSG